MSDVFEGFGCVLAANVEEDFFAAASTVRVQCSTFAKRFHNEGLAKYSGASPGNWIGQGGGEVGDIRMLVDEGRGVVDFVVDYEVEILDARPGKVSAIGRAFLRGSLHFQ